MLSQIVQRGSAVLRTTKVGKEAPTIAAPGFQAPKVSPYHVAPVNVHPGPVATSSMTVGAPHVDHTREFQPSSGPRPRTTYSAPHQHRSPPIPQKIGAPSIPIPGLTHTHPIIGRTSVVSPQQAKPKSHVPVPPPTAPEKGMIVEFLGSDGSYRLGLVGSRVSEGTEDVWQVSEKANDVAITHEIPASQITFCWPHFHNSNAYHFSVDHLSALTEQIQQDLEKYRTQLLVFYGQWLESSRTTITTEKLAADLFHQQPRPHEVYVAHRLLQEAEAHVRLGPVHPGTSIVAEYRIKPLLEMSKASKTTSESQKSRETNLFLHRFARRIWSTRPTKTAESDSPSSSSFSYMMPAPITAETLEQYLSVLPELTEADRRLNVQWNPYRDASFIAELKKYAFSNATTVEIGHTITRLLDPLKLHTAPEAVFKLLVQIGAAGAFDNPHAARFPGKLHWTGADMKVYVPQGITLTHADRDSKTRRDYRGYNNPIFAIDSRSESDEIDDAVSVFRAADGSTWVHIHIADPSRFVNPNDSLDNVARQRVQSVYLPEKTATMFPPNFARQNFSLLPDKVNYALTFAVKLDPATGQILSYDIAPSLIDKVTALTYDQADDIIVSSQKRAVPKRHLPPSHVASLNTLLELADARRKHRERAGAVIFADSSRPEIEVVKNGEKIDVHAVRDSESLSRGMVSEFMILVGEVTAMFASRHAIPIPFRSQAKRGEQIVSSSAAAITASQVASLSPQQAPPSPSHFTTRTRLCPAVTAVQPGEHAGLGLKAYCQASSPIRRYTDLLVHHQIKSVLRGESLPFSSTKLSMMIKEAEETQVGLNTLASNSSRYWIQRFLERQDPNRQYEALIASDAEHTEFSSLKCSAWLTELGWKTDIYMDGERAYPSIGDRVYVTVRNVDAFNDEIEFREVMADASHADLHLNGEEFGAHPSASLQL